MQKVIKRGMPSFIPRNIIPRASVAPEPAKIISPGIYRPDAAAWDGEVAKRAVGRAVQDAERKSEPKRAPIFSVEYILEDPERAAMLLNACYYDLAETEKRLAGPNGAYKR